MESKKGTYHYHNGGTSKTTKPKTVKSDETVDTIYIVSKNANLRDGPSSEYPIVNKIEKGTQVKIKKISGDYALITLIYHPDIEAWIYKPFLEPY